VELELFSWDTQDACPVQRKKIARPVGNRVVEEDRHPEEPILKQTGSFWEYLDLQAAFEICRRKA